MKSISTTKKTTKTTDSTLFFRLLATDDKIASLTEAVTAIKTGQAHSTAYLVDPASFRQITGSPFAYWVSQRVRKLFAELSPFESVQVHSCKGPDTGNDFRFLRAWWEVISQNVGRGQRWINHPKGGAYSQFYSDVHLVIDWQMDGKLVGEYGNIRNPGFFFRPGITWPRRTTSNFGPRAMPSGCIFADKGPATFVADDDLDKLIVILGMMNSAAFKEFVKLQLAAADASAASAAKSYEVGIIQRTPMPAVDKESGEKLQELVRRAIDLKMRLSTVEEVSHIFILPALLFTQGITLVRRSQIYQNRLDDTVHRLKRLQGEIDDIAFRLYSLDEMDRQAIEASFDEQLNTPSGKEIGSDEDTTEDEAAPAAEASRLVPDLLSYGVGCTFGRWDIRYATGKRELPELPDPFAPLPAYSLGMLATRPAPNSYPLMLDRDGILVDDPDHPDDVVRRLREVLELLWSDRAEAIEREANEILGVKELRAYFRNPGNGGFWQDHIKRYSKSRRKAPIYWLLQSSRKNYALWLYYHRLDKDILYKALVNYVEPKIRLEESKLEGIRDQLPGAGSQGSGAGGRSQKALEKELDQQESFVAELHDFRDKLRRAAHLNLEPDLNDGVVLNIAPLWELVPWKEARQYWEELLAGKYEWSSIGRQLREKGLVKG
ncbi:MAG: hypothetical protein KJ077_27940 [Anaerolineae bacterium]|nr:hypothetical protein [Anaerolineae bacterium]